MAERPQTKKIVLIVVLGIVLATVLVLQPGGLLGWATTGVPRNVPSSSDPKNESRAEPNDPAPASVAATEISSKWKRPEAVGPIAGDPMRMDVQEALLTAEQTENEPNKSPGPDQPQFVMTGIIFSAEQPSIIVDGHILHEGETIYGVTVTKIAEDHAELRREDKTWTVKPGEASREP